MNAERYACIHCDLPLAIGELRGGQRALCPRCGQLISACIQDALQRALAFALAAVVLLVLSNAFPFLSLKASGLESVMTIPATAADLHRDGYTALAVLVLGVIVVVPGAVLAVVLALVIPLLQRRNVPWLLPAGRLIFQLSPWSMVEVFIIGVIVSLVTIHHMATVVIGLSFWSYVGFSLCFVAAMASLDRLQVWREIEACKA